MKNFNKGFAPVLIIIIVVGVLAVGGVTYYVSKNSNSFSQNGGKSDLVKGDSYFSGKITDMFKNGKPLECSTEVANQEGVAKAVYYFDNENKMVRVEMQMVNKSDGTTVNTVSIIKDNWNYFWDDLMNKDGIKMKFTENQVNEVSKSEENDLAPDMSDEFDFICKSWKVDSTKFDIPKDKNFKDLSDMMNGIGNFTNLKTGGSGDSVNNLCNVCNMIPAGPEKNECLNSCKQQR